MSKALERRTKLREALIEAAERSLAAGGLPGLKTRDLAREIGCANGAVYNLVADMDELILLVGSRTLARLDAALTAAESNGPASPRETLVRIDYHITSQHTLYGRWIGDANTLIDLVTGFDTGDSGDVKADVLQREIAEYRRAHPAH